MVCAQRLLRDFEASNSSKSGSLSLQNWPLNVPRLSEFSEGRDTKNPFIVVSNLLCKLHFSEQPVQTMEDH